MTTIKLQNGNEYRVEFRHRTSKLSPQQKRPAGYVKAPIKALTTCVIVRDGYVGIGNSICSLIDNFDRHQGMARAFVRAVEDCRVWADDMEELFAIYDTIWTAKPSPTPRVVEKLSDDEKQKRIAAGSKTRDARSRRGGASS